MGVVRTALALFVVLAHIAGLDQAAGRSLGGLGGPAVNLFFVISGFYMALVLDTKYRDDLMGFYRARALRLYPLYWLTLLLTWALIWNADTFLGREIVPRVDALLNGAPFWVGFTVFSHVTFVGLDVAALSGWPRFVAVPPAWSLGCEVAFYLMIPFIIRAGRLGVVVATIIGVVANVALVITGQFHESWVRFFYPAGLLYFMLGVIAYYAYRHWRLPDLSRFSLPLTTAIVAVLIFLAVFPQPRFEMALIFTFAALLPFLFQASKDSSLDRLIGELSYPLYIIHFPLLALTIALLTDAPISGYVRTFTHLAIVVGVAIVAVAVVTVPVDRIRHRGRKMSAMASTG